MATNFIDYGNKAVENGIIDGGKHEILYFHAGSNNDWFNSANWYYDNAFTIPANKYPDSDDIVYIVDENVSSSRNVVIRIDYLSVTRTGYGVNWNTGPQHIEFGNGLNIECSYGAVFNNLSDYGCGYLKNYANITAPTITFNLSSNYGTLNGATVFAYNYGPCENFGNFGTVNGTASFNSGGDTYSYSAKNQGTINGNATFYNNAANTSIINGNANFYNYSASLGGQINGNSNFNDSSWVENATLSGNVNFYTGSYANSCSIFGNVFLYNSSSISYSTIYGDVDCGSNSIYSYGNTVNGNLSLTSAIFYSSTINGNVVLNGSSYTDGCTINGNATVNAYSYISYCTINGLAELYNSSYCIYGTINNANLFGSSYIDSSYISNDIVLNDYSYMSYSSVIDAVTLNNSARLQYDNSAGSAIFNNSSYNDANANLTCSSVVFNNYSDNNGTVTGNATFNDASDNNGTVSGTVTCNTTGVCVTPSGSSTNSDLALLMHFEGGPSFEDSSLHRLAITATGTPSITSIESKFGNSSCVFNGSTDYLTTNISPSYDNDFTIDFWFMRTGVGNGQANTILDIGNLQITQGGLHLYTDSYGSVFLNNGISAGISAGNAPLNQWIHIAIVRNNATNTLYLDGVSVGTSDQTFPVSNSIINIGAAPNYGFYTQGYIDELRIVKGVALYTSNFTPPTTPYQDPEPPNPSLLMHFDGPSFVDSSLNNYSIINHGASLSTLESKFGGSSLILDGQSSFLEINAPNLASFGLGDFTVEWWEKPQFNNNGYFFVLSCGRNFTTLNGNENFGIRHENNGSFIRIQIDSNSFDFNTSPPSQWRHCALVRYNGVLKLYFDGIAGNEAHNTSSIDILQNNSFIGIGISEVFFAGNIVYSPGNIDELRIVKGKALYISNFLPPTAPTQNPIVPDLLLNFEGSDGSSSFVDSSPNALTIATNGSPTISTSQKRIGGSSGYFNDASSLSLSSYPSFMSGSDDFTIECWIYLNDTGWNGICGSSDPGSLVLATANGDIWLGTANLGPPDGWTVTATGVLSINTWYHVAAVRSAGEMKIFVNGILKNTITETRPFAVSSGFSIGNLSGEGGWYLNGYIDELRIVKGTALYTTNFNPF